MRLPIQLARVTTMTDPLRTVKSLRCYLFIYSLTFLKLVGTIYQ